MTFVRKFRGTGGPIVAVYTCPEHGEFTATVERDANGEAPDWIRCPLDPELSCNVNDDGDLIHVSCGGKVLIIEDGLICDCGQQQCVSNATWTPTPIAGRVRRVEVSRGKWEKPERKTYLDTRKLGEGQDPAEFRAERKKVWDEQRRARVKELLR